MIEWLSRFYEKAANVTLILNGETIKREDCTKIGGGDEKLVYKIKDQNLCFFIPNGGSTEENWNALIKQEKSLLDQIDYLGLKTQRFEIVPLEIKEPGKTSYSIPVLLTKDFESLCKEESITIYNAKAKGTQFIGTPLDFNNIQEILKNKILIQEMFNKIINEYALALTFSLPINTIRPVDDSEHYCFELSKDPNQTPVARYMFWDVVSDFGGLEFPYVPTLSILKAGNKDNKGNSGLSSLANKIACAMYEMNSTTITAPGARNFVKKTEADITSAIEDDNFLNQALVHARKVSALYLNSLLPSMKEVSDDMESVEFFVSIMQSAISTSDLNLVKDFFHLPSAKALPSKSIDKLLEFARQYENQDIIAYLKNEKSLEVTARLASTDAALIELATKVNDIKQFRWPKAHQEAKLLLETLESYRNKYKTNLEQEEFNVAMEKTFKEKCSAAIREARPILEKDLNWGPYIQNLLKIFANTSLAIIGQNHLFFKLTESESLKSVLNVAENMKLDREALVATL